MSVDRDFGPRLRRTRLDRRLSQNALAVICGIPKSRLSRYENGHLLPSLATLERLATALDTSPALLMGSTSAIDAFAAELSAQGVRFESEREARDAAKDVARRLLLDATG